MSKLVDCIFCKIIAGEILNSTVFENDAVLAFLDISPAAPGHTLVIPKKHSMNISEMDPVDLHEVMSAAQSIAPKITQAVGAEGFNLIFNTNKAAGQAVFHTHLHIIPRKDDDGIKLWTPRKYKDGEMKMVLEKITQLLS